MRLAGALRKYNNSEIHNPGAFSTKRKLHFTHHLATGTSEIFTQQPVHFTSQLVPTKSSPINPKAFPSALRYVARISCQLGSGRPTSAGHRSDLRKRTDHSSHAAPAWEPCQYEKHFKNISQIQNEITHKNHCQPEIRSPITFPKYVKRILMLLFLSPLLTPKILLLHLSQKCKEDPTFFF